MAVEEVDGFLAHYGVPGMRWGRRKSGSSTVSTRTDTHPDRAEVDKLKRNKPRTLSNSEIQRINTRLNLEKQLGNLKQDQAQGKIKKGKAWVDLAVAAAGTAGAVYGLSKTELGKAVIQGIRKTVTG